MISVGAMAYFRKDALDAVAAAQRSASAAERSAAAAEAAATASREYTMIESERLGHERTVRAQADAAALKADLRVHVEPTGGNADRLVVVNHGPADATGVHLEPIGWFDAVLEPEALRNVDIRAGNRRGSLLATSLADPRVGAADLSWTDPAGFHNERLEIELSP